MTFVKNLPIGRDNFKDVIEKDLYYVDKIYEYAIAIGRKECSVK